MAETAGTGDDEESGSNCAGTGTGNPDNLRARLPWSNGALGFLQGPHAWMIEELVSFHPDEDGVDKPWVRARAEDGSMKDVKLMSKYVLSSPLCYDDLLLALQHGKRPQGGPVQNPPGVRARDAYLMSRAGTAVETCKIELQGTEVAERGRSAPLGMRGTDQKAIVISMDGREDVIKWKLGFFTESADMTFGQMQLSKWTQYDKDLGEYPALPKWANGAIVFAADGAEETVKAILKWNNVVPRDGDIILCPVFGSVHTVLEQAVNDSLKLALGSFVYLLTIKGNLRYRIEKLGIEGEDGQYSDKQKVLRKIADMQRYSSCLRESSFTAARQFLDHVRGEGEESRNAGASAAAASVGIRPWEHPYACPTCGSAYTRWGLVYAHMGMSEACGIPNGYSFGELQKICREAAARVEGASSDLFSIQVTIDPNRGAVFRDAAGVVRAVAGATIGTQDRSSQRSNCPGRSIAALSLDAPSAEAE